jgi:outer membrane protein TolC
MPRIFTLPALILSGGLLIQAQGTAPVQPISLREALKVALEQNLQIQIAREARTATGAGIPIAEGVFDWNLFSSFSYGRQDSAATRGLYPTGPLARTEGTAWSRTFSLGLQKPFTWGGSFQIAYTPSYAFSEGQYLNPSDGSPIGTFGTKYPYSGSLSGTYTQNLLRGFGRPVNEVGLIVARNSSQSADHQFTLAVIALVANTEAQYWDLVYATRNLENTKAALALAQEQLDDNRGKVREGTLPEIEITSAEAAVAKQKLALVTARSELRNAQDTLLRTLYPGEAPRSKWLEPTDAPDLAAPQLDEAAAEALAVQDRLELKAARLAQASASALRRAAQNRLLPQLNGFVSYQATSDTHTALGPVQSDLANGTYPGYAVGLTFSVPLANRTAKGGLSQAQAQERASELAVRDLELSIRLQVRLAFERVQASREAVDAARTARVFREEDLQAEKKKYENGMSTNFLVFAKQNDLDSARAAELQAQIGYAKAVTALEQAMGQLLEARGFVTRDPSSQTALPGGAHPRSLP